MLSEQFIKYHRQEANELLTEINAVKVQYVLKQAQLEQMLKEYNIIAEGKYQLMKISAKNAL